MVKLVELILNLNLNLLLFQILLVILVWKVVVLINNKMSFLIRSLITPSSINFTSLVKNNVFNMLQSQFKLKSQFKSSFHVHSYSPNVFKPFLFTYDAFNKESFIKFLLETFELNTSYSILLKVSFDGNTVFYMLDRQMGISVGDQHDLKYYEYVYDHIIFRVDVIMERYDKEYKPDTITILYKQLSISADMVALDKKSLLPVNLNKSIFSKTSLTKMSNSTYLPLN